MDVELFREKISKISRGARIHVTPYSVHYGDSFTTIGVPCTNPAKSAVELKEPFIAQMDNFDGEVLWIRTQEFYCLKIVFRDLKDVNVLVSNHWEGESSKKL